MEDGVISEAAPSPASSACTPDPSSEDALVNSDAVQLYIERCEYMGVQPTFEFLLTLQGSSSSSTWATNCVLSRRRHPLQDADIMCIAWALRLEHRIAHLDLSGNSFTTAGVEAICEGLQHAPSLRSLNLSFNNIGDDGARYIADFLANHHSLKYLELDQTGIGPQGGTMLAESLRSNGCLLRLNLRYNQISDSTAVEFGKTLSSEDSICVLEELYLGNNKISADGAVQFAKMIQDCKSLKVLDLQGVQFEQPDLVQHFAHHIKHNSCLEQIMVDIEDTEDTFSGLFPHVQPIPVESIQRDSLGVHDVKPTTHTQQIADSFTASGKKHQRTMFDRVVQELAKEKAKNTKLELEVMRLKSPHSLLRDEETDSTQEPQLVRAIAERDHTIDELRRTVEDLQGKMTSVEKLKQDNSKIVQELKMRSQELDHLKSAFANLEKLKLGAAEVFHRFTSGIAELKKRLQLHDNKVDQLEAQIDMLRNVLVNVGTHDGLEQRMAAQLEELLQRHTETLTQSVCKEIEDIRKIAAPIHLASGKRQQPERRPSPSPSPPQQLLLQEKEVQVELLKEQESISSPVAQLLVDAKKVNHVHRPDYDGTTAESHRSHRRRDVCPEVQNYLEEEEDEEEEEEEVLVEEQKQAQEQEDKQKESNYEKANNRWHSADDHYSLRPAPDAIDAHWGVMSSQRDPSSNRIISTTIPTPPSSARPQRQIGSSAVRDDKPSGSRFSKEDDPEDFLTPTSLSETDVAMQKLLHIDEKVGHLSRRMIEMELSLQSDPARWSMPTLKLSSRSENNNKRQEQSSDSFHNSYNSTFYTHTPSRVQGNNSRSGRRMSGRKHIFSPGAFSNLSSIHGDLSPTVRPPASRGTDVFESIFSSSSSPVEKKKKKKKEQDRDLRNSKDWKDSPSILEHCPSNSLTSPSGTSRRTQRQKKLSLLPEVWKFEDRIDRLHTRVSLLEKYHLTEADQRLR